MDLVDTEFLIAVLASLIRIPSVNPGTSEAAVVACLEEWLTAETSAELRRVDTFPDRPSLAAVLRGSEDGPILVLNGHTDTVPIGNQALWTTDPFGAEIIQGELYGRGACDMKGGLALAVAVARAITSAKGAFRGALVVHFACGEERAEPGTQSLLDAGFTGNCAIVLEPTNLKVATCARGLAFYDIEVMGRSSHGSVPSEALNPILALPGVLQAVADHEAAATTRAHPLLPPPSASPTIVRAGVKENMIPDTAGTTVDRRLLPGEDIDAVRNMLEEQVRAHLDPAYGLRVDTLDVRFAPAEADQDSSIASAVRSAVTASAGFTPSAWGTPYSSDFRCFVERDIPAVTFGPGRIEHAHAIDEHIAVDELTTATQIVLGVAADVLALVPRDS